MNTIEKVLFLHEVPLLRALPLDALGHLASMAREETLEEGAPLWKAGAPSDSVYFVLDGLVTLFSPGGEPLGNLGGGADLGAACLFVPSRTRDNNVVATHPTRLLKVGREEFIEVLTEHPDAARALLEALGGRLRRHATRLDVGHLSAQSSMPAVG